MRLVYSRAAERDLDRIFDHTASNWGKAQAQRYLRDLLDACSAAAAGSRVTQSAEEVKPGYRRLTVRSHTVFLRFEDDRLVVSRILHQSMDVPRHL